MARSFCTAPLVTLTSLALGACGSSTGATNGTTSSRTSTASTSTAASSGTTTGASGTTGAGSTSGATSSSSSSGGPACSVAGGSGVWVNGVCLVQTCAPVDGTNLCLLPDAGIGQCEGTVCVPRGSLTDSSNCSFPGVVCPASTTCQNGVCKGASFSVIGCSDGGCPAGLTCDPNQSACDLPTCTAANEGESCLGDGGPVNGAFGGLYTGSCCGGACVNTQQDITSCGACGSTCPGNSICVEGTCTADCSTAPNNAGCTYALLADLSSQTGFCCGGACLSSAGSDPNNCGSCGAACATGQSCTQAQCSLPCTASGATCSTGSLCVPATQECLSTTCGQGSDGVACAFTDRDGLNQPGMCCGNVCTDITADSQSCGGCGQVCPSGFGCSAPLFSRNNFADGLCLPVADCAALQNGTFCLVDGGVHGECCGGACTDPSTDNANCLGCGNVCPTSSACVPNPGTPFVSACFAAGASLNCTTSDCPAGTACGSDGLCHVDSCSGLPDQSVCVSDGTKGICCGGACVDPTSDSSNCSTCGQTCVPGSSCVDASCMNAGSNVFCSASAPCPSGTLCASAYCLPDSCTGLDDGDGCTFGPYLQGTCCGGSCVGTYENSQNCGGCGRDCDGAVCTGGYCANALYPAGECSPPCTDGQVCAQSLCVTSQCDPAIGSGEPCAAQDGTVGLCCPQTGVCPDLSNDPQNCGGCGLSCDGGTCTGGQCAGAACDSSNQGGYCGGLEGSKICCGAACVDIASDDQSCGVCGNACAVGTVCAAGVCQ